MLTVLGGGPVRSAYAGAPMTEVSEYEKVQLTIRDALSPEHEVSADFTADRFPTEGDAGTLTITAIENQKYTLVLYSATEIKNVNQDLVWEASGTTFSFVHGILTEPSGAWIGVSAIVANKMATSGEMVNFVFPMATPSPAEMQFTVDLDLYHNSTPQSIVDGTPDGARIPGPVGMCAGLTGAALCVCTQQVNFDICLAAANRSKNICLIAANTTLMTALIICGLPATVPVIGWLVGGGCAAVALYALIIANAVCVADYLSDKKTCEDLFHAALVGCNVTVNIH